jgi:hypothetical protein
MSQNPLNNYNQVPDIENQQPDTENNIRDYLTGKMVDLQVRMIELKVELEILKKKHQYDINYVFIVIILTNLGYVINLMLFNH